MGAEPDSGAKTGLPDDFFDNAAGGKGDQPKPKARCDLVPRVPFPSFPRRPGCAATLGALCTNTHADHHRGCLRITAALVTR